MEIRKATNQEILDANRSRVTGKYRSVRFRHFVREMNMPHAKNGVAHRQYSNSILRDVDGVPHVRQHGELHPVQASHFTLDNGTTLVCLIKLDSPYL